MFHYTKEEKEINKVIKRNQDRSQAFLEDSHFQEKRQEMNSAIHTSEALLRSLGYGSQLEEIPPEPSKKRLPFFVCYKKEAVHQMYCLF